MTAFDLVFRGGLLIDGTGAPPRSADVGVNRRPVALGGAETGERPGRLLRHV